VAGQITLKRGHSDSPKQEQNGLTGLVFVQNTQNLAGDQAFIATFEHIRRMLAQELR
jgi:hypothetical protein